jgi:hypothetical protein
MKTRSKAWTALQKDFAAIYNFKDDGKYLQVRDQEGNWIFRSKRMILENPDLPQPDRIPSEGIQSEFHQGTRVYVCSRTPSSCGESATRCKPALRSTSPPRYLPCFRTDCFCSRRQ